MLLRNRVPIASATAGRMFGAAAAPTRPFSRVQACRIFSDYDGLPAGKVDASLWLPPKEGAVSATVYAESTATGEIAGRGMVDATVQGQATTTADIGGLYAIAGSAQGLATTTAPVSGRGHLSATLSIGSRPTAEEINNALLDTQFVEPGLTLRQALRLMAAALAGKASGAASTGGTVKFRNAVADSKDRITAVVDANGNRTSITLDAS